MGVPTPPRAPAVVVFGFLGLRGLRVLLQQRGGQRYRLSQKPGAKVSSVRAFFCVEIWASVLVINITCHFIIVSININGAVVGKGIFK